MPWLPAHYKLIEKLKKNQLVGRTPALNGKAYWFAYFWEECGEIGFLEPVKDAVARLFNHIFVLPDHWDPTSADCKFTITKSGRISAKARVNMQRDIYLPINVELGRAKSWETAPDADLLVILEQLLVSGFIRVPGNAGTQSPDSSLDVFRSTMTSGFGGRQYKLGWRGDSRSIQDIGAAGGLKNKADSEGYAQRVNLRASWNPFSKSSNRADYFYRKNKNDNCLATIVSISTSFQTAATFPLLNKDFIVSLPARLPNLNQLHGIDPRHKRILHLTTGNSGGKLVRVADRQQLYLVVVEGNYFDTEKAQARTQGEAEKFPEFAVKCVPETGILACLSFVRVHHGLDEHGGLTVLLDSKNCLAPTLDGCRRYCQAQSAARELFRVIQDEYNAAVRSMPFHVKWKSNGSEVVRPMQVDNSDMVIQEVKNLLGQKLWP